MNCDSGLRVLLAHFVQTRPGRALCRRGRSPPERYRGNSAQIGPEPRLSGRKYGLYAE